jgi:sulfopyruvate decarboxylase TPP-binding subunit
MSTTEATATKPVVAKAIAGEALAQRIRGLGVTHIVCVPDTNLKTAIAALHGPDMPTMLYSCTEDEAMGINAGLYISGHRPLMLIQNNGLYACLNTLKAIALDSNIPTCMVIGEYARDPHKASEDNPSRQVRMLRPTLRTWGVDTYSLEGPENLDQLDLAWKQAWEHRTAVAAVVGAVTI